MRHLLAAILFLGAAAIANAQVSFNGQTPCGKAGRVYVNESAPEVVRMQVANSCSGNATITVTSPGFPPTNKAYSILADQSLALRVPVATGGTIDVQSAGTATSFSSTVFYYLRLP